MPTFKVPVDKKGNFYSKHTFNHPKPDSLKCDPEDTKLKLKLLKPKDAYIKVMTLTIKSGSNQKTLNYEVSTGQSVTVGPFPIGAKDNQISFEGTSDKPDQVHEIEVSF
jgi:hypothetical protein